MGALKKKTLVVGGSGVIGSAHIRHLAAAGEPVLGLSRSEAGTGQPEIHADLMSGPPSCSAELTDVTHLVYAGFVPAQGDDALRRANTELFKAALDLADRCSVHLRHVTLLQGMKAYGSHLGPFKTPARENDPRIPGGHFYDDQLDILQDMAGARGWDWTVLRPHVVIGPARRSPQNLIAVLGVYASLRKADGLPLDFPGPEAAFDVIYQATDAGLLSRAIQWAGSEPRAAGEIFNITNGDFFRWRHVWPKVAAAFDMEPAGPAGLSLQQSMRNKNAAWDALVERHGLEANRIEDLVSWRFADYIFGTTWDVMADTLKCRQAGFLEFVDSESMITDRLKELKELKIVP